MYSDIAKKQIPVLSVFDDGHGMTHEQISEMVAFGRKRPAANGLDHVGRFGLGFKAYKRVGGMVKNKDKSRGLIGVIDVTNVMKAGVTPYPYKPDYKWVQCDKCRKWRRFTPGSVVSQKWLCSMELLNGKCEVPEEKVKSGDFTSPSKRSKYHLLDKASC